MATNTAGVDTRLMHWHGVHFMRKTVNYNDTDIASGVGFKHYLPSGARVLFTNVVIKTAFNAGTTNVLTVGQNASYNDFVASGDVDEASTGSNMVLRGADVNISADVRPFIKYTQTGTAATAGVAEVIIVYVPNMDE